MKLKLFTHTDLDGVGCAVLGEFINRNEISIEYCEPHTIDNIIGNFLTQKEYEKFDKVFITDLSVSIRVAQRIDAINSNMKIRLFDHHKTAIHLNTYDWATVQCQYANRDTCGTELFWNYISEEYITTSNNDELIHRNCSLFVELVRLYDTWNWKNDKQLGKMASDLNSLLKVYSRLYFINNMVDKLILSTTSELISDIDKKILDVDDMGKKRYITHKEKTMITKKYENYTVGILFAEQYISELGNYLVTKHKNIDFVTIIIPDVGKVSLRSNRDDVDVSKIALKFNGGGHPKASGFLLNKEVMNLFINSIFE